MSKFITPADPQSVRTFNRAQIHDDLRLHAQFASLGVKDDETRSMIEIDRQQNEQELFGLVDCGNYVTTKEL